MLSPQESRRKINICARAGENKAMNKLVLHWQRILLFSFLFFLQSLFHKRRQTWAMLITGNTSLPLFAKEKAHGLRNNSCRGAASTNNGGHKPRRPMKRGACWTEHRRAAPQFTPAQFTYVNRRWGVVWRWEHDDSLSLNRSFVFMAKGGRTLLL